MSKKNKKSEKYSEAGKGDKSRVDNPNKYAENWKKYSVRKNLRNEKRNMVYRSAWFWQNDFS